MRKSNGFFLFNKFVQNFIFLQLQIKKVGFITLMLGKFQILKANLWLIYNKRFEFMVYNFIFVF